MSAALRQPSLDEARATILAAGYREVEYLELRGETDLRALASLDRPARLLVAAWLGDTRLIDNVSTSPPGNWSGSRRCLQAEAGK
ncbi:pantoate--beta-alanine ligase [Mesorhizobium sp. AR07]|uniref:pantoate--beta-alanine ligase n=1 Tax=Mesorhizobium sp. AR07 TaxID=2865838 RepID=UPI00215F3DD7|nr:pantoate--beta-alanine ligase [Mesorhizobium sp. AR07]